MILIMSILLCQSIESITVRNRRLDVTSCQLKKDLDTQSTGINFRKSTPVKNPSLIVAIL